MNNCRTEQNRTESLIIIGGGVGPLAGVKAAEQLIEHTFAKTDQEHPQSTLILADKRISDRTRYLLDKEYRRCNASPAVGMAQAVQERAIGFNGNVIITGVPCNTFHSFTNEYIKELEKVSNDIGKEIKFVNMITETAKMISELLPHVKKIGVMSTTGTRELKIYHKILNALNIQTIEVSSEKQRELHNTIYNKEWGIKSSNWNKKKTIENFEKYATDLKNQGAEALVLGCTEIPLVLKGFTYESLPLIDPVTALVRGLLREATVGKKLKPLDKKKYKEC